MTAETEIRGGITNATVTVTMIMVEVGTTRGMIGVTETTIESVVVIGIMGEGKIEAETHHLDDVKKTALGIVVATPDIDPFYHIFDSQKLSIICKHH